MDHAARGRRCCRLTGFWQSFSRGCRLLPGGRRATHRIPGTCRPLPGRGHRNLVGNHSCTHADAAWADPADGYGFRQEVFVRIDRIGLLSTIGLCGALGLLLILTLPVGEFEQLPNRWFPILYNVLVGITGILTGMLISTVLMLFSTLRRVISRVTPSDTV